MTALLIVLSLVLIAIVALQIGKVDDLSARIRGEEQAKDRINRNQSTMLLVFLPLFLGAVIWSALYYKNYMMGFGPHEPASALGHLIDQSFWTTTVFTGIVFIVTHIALFWFSYKFRQRKNVKAQFIPHDNRLEIVWTVLPALVMTYLVVGGLDAWNEVTADIGTDEEVLEIEAMGYQFAWNFRYPGADGKMGARDYRLTTGTNPVGQDWTDEKNLDDVHPSELWLPVGQKVRVKIIARDVLHDFWLPHFRVKMDAVPGMPTYVVFTPTKTTEEYRQMLSKYPEYNQPDPNDPEKMLWQTFEYELACAELCGTGHWSMRKLVKVVSQAEYDAWLAKQPSHYMSAIHGTEADPWPIDGRLPSIVASSRQQEFQGLFDAAMAGTTKEEKTFVLKYVSFNTGSAGLDQLSHYELANVVEAMKANPDLVIELSGHTDNVGDPEANLALSQHRADAVYQHLISKGISADRLRAVGYGETSPLDTNATEKGRAKNRRTAFTIVSGNELAQVANTEE